MSEWQECKFSDLLVDESISYGIVQPGQHTEINAVPVIRVNNIKNNKIETDDVLKVSSKIEEKYQRTRLEGGELLITVVGSIGECAIVPNHLKGWNVARAVSVARIKKNFDKRFIKYCFKLDDLKFQMYGNTNDTVQPTLNLSSLKNLVLNVPTLPAQQAIANILSSLDDKIDLLHRQNKTLEAMAETLFRQWFIEEANEDWEEKPLKDVVNVIDNRGKTPPYQDIPTPFPIIEVNALTGTNRLVDYSAIRKYVTEDIFNSWFRGHPKKFDTLISTVGSIGEISMYLVELGSVAQNVVALSAKNISPFYLFEFLKHSKDEIKELDIGSVQPSIKVPHLLSIKITIPPVEKFKLFDSQVESYLARMLMNQKQIKTLEKLRDNLLPKLMSGEVRVRLTEQDHVK